MRIILILNYTVVTVEQTRGDIMKNILLVVILVLSGMSGCLGEELDKMPIVGPEPQTSEYNHSDAYQFNNLAPMGIGNSTQVNLNGTNMSVWVEVNMSAGFHEPLFWEQGSVNVSILDDNETVIWTNKSSSGQINHTLVVSDNYSYTGNLTLRIMADGSDNATDGEVADWYVVRYIVLSEWRDF